MAGMLRVPRSRGALTGLLLVLLGAWGALIPFVGPYFHYAYTPDKAWQYTSGRLWLDILPGAAAVLGGLILMAAGSRPTALFGGLLAAAGGAWFTVGIVLMPLWAGPGTGTTGLPVGDTLHQTMERIGFYYGLGVAIVLVAGLALGRVSAVTLRDVRYAESREAALADDTEVAETETGIPAPRQPA